MSAKDYMATQECWKGKLQANVKKGGLWRFKGEILLAGDRKGETYWVKERRERKLGTLFRVMREEGSLDGEGKGGRRTNKARCA